MSRLQTIESRLLQINATLFQELCDSYLTLREKTYTAVTRTGSQIGKQKTTKGTPDTFYQLNNGNFLFVEITTDTSTKNKLANDIRACFNSKKSKIAVEKIQEIILCFNWNIQQDEIDSLTALAKDFNPDIQLRFLMLQELAIELHLNHRDLAHLYLGLPLDTGQIVSIDNFILEYDRASKGIATPLNNLFLHREEELKKLKQAIDNYDFVLINGAPGVGKTKLAIEALSSYLKSNELFEAYCVSYKNHTLLDDLYQYIDTEKDYLLFVDDANRIDAFEQITGFYKAHRKGRLKIIITVRDYAFQQIGRKCQEFSTGAIEVLKFSDEKITDIIKGKPFDILNPDYQKEIVRISDGNPRLAIMASLLATKEQNLSALHDVSDLFEKYFSTFVNDNGDFENSLSIRCLAIISFFYTIPHKNRKVTESILKKFDITYNDFIDAIDKLDKLELLEIQFEHVKIPEQNLSLFFFYKGFLNDNQLSFKVLLANYFDQCRSRFNDCIIPANNTFGDQNVMGKIKPDLVEYYMEIRSDAEKSLTFLKSFWFYLQPQTLDFAYHQIDSLSEKENPVFETFYERNQFTYKKDSIIELVGNFFYLYSKSLRDAAELLFEYGRRAPEKFPEILHKIKDLLIFDRDDQRYGFYKQKILFEILTEGVKKNDQLLCTAFFELSKTFLETRVQQFKSGRNNTFVHYQYQLPLTDAIKNFRTKIWNTLDENFETHPIMAFDLLKNAIRVQPDSNVEIMAFDLPYVVAIIKKHLNDDDFTHCRYVQEQIRWFKKKELNLADFDVLTKRFTNEDYKTYLKINWDWNRDREMFEFADHKEYNRLKEAELRASFVFEKNEQVSQFYRTFLLLRNAAENNWNYNNALEMIIDQNCSVDFEIGIALLERVIKYENEIRYVPRILFHNQLKNSEKAERIWKLIQESEFQCKENWELAYFDFIDESLINEEMSNLLLDTISEMQDSNFIMLNRLERFLGVVPDLFKIIIKAVTEKNESAGTQIHLWEDIFSKNFENLGDDLDLIKKAYIQQNALQNHFDYNGEGILTILKKEPRFLVEYVESLFSISDSLHGHDSDMSYIWNLENITDALREVFDLLISKQVFFGILEHYCNVFFKNPQLPENRSKGDNFIRDYVAEHNKDYKKMQIIVDILRHSRTDLFSEVFQLYLSYNQNVKTFSRLMWRGNGGTYSGDVIIGDIKAAEWRDLLEMANKSNLGIKMIPIKNYIKEQIEGCLSQADWERQRKFLSSRF